ncbi:MAG: hypothetical protein R2839_03510 [Thermomicrobiales bacterium]
MRRHSTDPGVQGTRPIHQHHGQIGKEIVPAISDQLTTESQTLVVIAQRISQPTQESRVFA